MFSFGSDQVQSCTKTTSGMNQVSQASMGTFKGDGDRENDPKLGGCRGMVTKSFKTCIQPQNEVKVLVGIILLHNSDLSWSLSTVSTRNQQIVSPSNSLDQSDSVSF